MDLIGSGVALVDAGSDVLLVLEASLHRLEVVCILVRRLVDSLEGDLCVIVQQIAAQDLCVGNLFLDLDHVPVRIALEVPVLVVVCEGQIEIGGVELLVDLLVQDVCNLFIQCHDRTPLACFSIA